MRINGNNLIALILAIFGLVLLTKNLEPIRAFLGSMNDIGPGHTADEKTAGLIALGLVGICIVAVVKILTQNRDR